MFLNTFSIENSRYLTIKKDKSTKIANLKKIQLLGNKAKFSLKILISS
jgi:hypothetical protein